MIADRAQYSLAPLPIEAELRSLFGARAPKVIFDIGCCEGEDTVKYAALFASARVFAVEPIPRNVERVRENIARAGRTNIEVLALALSDTRGTATLHVSSGQPADVREPLDWDFGNKSSSMYPPGEHMTQHPWCKFEEELEVTVDTLAAVCETRDIDAIDFIHMDVQGAELNVLRGAGALLRNIRAIWLEVSQVALYRGQPLKHDVVAFMLRNGFVPVKDTTVNAVSGDMLFVNLRLG